MKKHKLNKEDLVTLEYYSCNGVTVWLTRYDLLMIEWIDRDLEQYLDYNRFINILENE